MLLNTLESVRSKVLSDFHLQCLPQCPLIRQGTPRRHPMRWELGARETIEMTRNDSKWLHFHLTFCRWPGFISHDLLFAGCWNPCKPSGVGSFSEWTIHFERITKFDFFDESKKGTVLFFERPALLCCPNACQRNRPLNFDANMGQLQGWRCEKWHASPFVTHENVSLRQRLMTWRVEAPAVKRGGHERMVTWSELVRKT